MRNDHAPGLRRVEGVNLDRGRCLRVFGRHVADARRGRPGDRLALGINGVDRDRPAGVDLKVQLGGLSLGVEVDLGQDIVIDGDAHLRKCIESDHLGVVAFDCLGADGSPIVIYVAAGDGCDDTATWQGDDLVAAVNDEGAGQRARPEARKLADVGIVGEGKDVDHGINRLAGGFVRHLAADQDAALQADIEGHRLERRRVALGPKSGLGIRSATTWLDEYAIRRCPGQSDEPITALVVGRRLNARVRAKAMCVVDGGADVDSGDGPARVVVADHPLDRLTWRGRVFELACVVDDLAGRQPSVARRANLGTVATQNVKFGRGDRRPGDANPGEMFRADAGQVEAAVGAVVVVVRFVGDGDESWERPREVARKRSRPSLLAKDPPRGGRRRGP